MPMPESASAPLGAAPPCPIYVVAMAASAGGLRALSRGLSELRAQFPAARVAVQHVDRHRQSMMAEILSRRTNLTVRQAEAGDFLCAGTAFIAPPDQHLLVNPDRSLSLSHAALVHFVRPSADLLFESVAASCTDHAI